MVPALASTSTSGTDAPDPALCELGVHVGRLALGGEERLAAERLPRGEVLPVPAVRDGECGRVGCVERAEHEVVGDERGLDHPIDATESGAGDGGR